MELFRLSDGLANRSFCRSDIWRVQLKSNCNHSLVMQANFTMKFFTIFNFKIYWIAKNFLWGSSQLVHMVLKELLRLSDLLANQSFCRSDISWAQLKSNWTFRERLLASYQDAARECRLILLKRELIFLQCLIWKIIHLEKIISDGALSLFTGYSGNSSHC